VNKIFSTFSFALTTSAFLALASISQDTSALSPPVPNWKPPAPTTIWRPPVLVIPNRDMTPIQLQTIRVSGDVSGRHATTEIDMTFFNPNSRVLEGELQFPLLDGQRVASFAMDVNGALREAVPVEKAKGQAVFEDVIRTRIDPGLLEVTQGNNFKLRVYPIPAQGTKRVVIRIAENLTDVGGDTIYRLPIGFAERVGMLEINVAISATDKAPTIRRNGFGPVNLSKDLLRNTYRLRESRRDFSVADSGSATIEFAIPNSANSAAPIVQTQIFEGKTYFVADVAIPSRESAREAPRSVGIIWDSSGSGRDRDHAREFQLLDTYFKKMRDGEVKLTQIRNVAEPAQTFRISNGDWKALRDVLSSTAYDGATNLNAFVPESNVREYLLFSDGLNNFSDGADKTGFAKTRVPLYSISASNKIDALFLKFIAERSGGRFIDLTRETSASAAAALLSAVTRVTQIDGAGTSQIVLAATHAIGGRVQVAGLLIDSNATLRVSLQHPDGKQETIDVPIQRIAKDDDNLGSAASKWAELRINELDAEYQLNRAEIRRLGQRFRLVTRETSLIILDRIEDYARFEIAPPSELRAEYDRILGSIQQQRRAERGNHLENIVRMFEQKVAWWNHSFPKNDRFVENKMKKSEERERGALFEGDAARADAVSQDRAPMRTQAMPTPPVVATPAMEAPAGRRSMMAPAAQPVSANADKRAMQNTAQSTSTIRLQKWEPNAPYADRLKRASNADLYRVYLDEAPGYLASTAFYLDAADLFFERGLNDLGIRVLSNLAEMDLENRHILRILGYRLMQANRAALAIPVFKRVLELSPEEPQSYRDLGLAYAADKQPQRAIDSLYDVVIRPWHGRFPEVELIALAELNSIVATTNSRLDTSRIDARLMKNLPLDLRAVLTWDADNTDIDLWVTDPNGEKASYSNRMTYQGGRMSLDFTGGYGPEEFSLKVAKPGKYRVQAQYFGDRRQNVVGATILQMRLTTGFGTRQQRDQIVTMRLKDGKETIMVGEFEIK
jgi:Ca-activated chloride channel homolog